MEGGRGGGDEDDWPELTHPPPASGDRQVRRWKADEMPKFKVVGNLENLRNAVRSGEADAFLWEVHTVS